MSNKLAEAERIYTPDRSALRQWLLHHHERQDGVWLVRDKKAFAASYVPYSEVVDELLCFGWVDSLPRKLNEQHSMLWIAPRRAKSNWSKINIEKVERLRAMGLMHPAGEAVVQKAVENGGWTALKEVDALRIPDDLAAALRQDAEAQFFFDRFPSSSKRGILEWLQSAKRPETREKRLKEILDKARENRKANFPKGRDAGPPLKAEKE